MGLTLGLKPALCARERNHDFTGLTTHQALESLVVQTSYKLTLVDGVYSITANDLSPMEAELQTHRFETFGSDTGTMSYFGALITGFIRQEVEGAGGFAVNVLGNPDDENISIPVYRNLTAPQIANRIVKQRSQGIWVMQTSQDDTKAAPAPIPARATVTMYSYHDLQGRLPEIKCPAPPRGPTGIHSSAGRPR